jgi:hypothetical protein
MKDAAQAEACTKPVSQMAAPQSSEPIAYSAHAVGKPACGPCRGPARSVAGNAKSQRRKPRDFFLMGPARRARKRRISRLSSLRFDLPAPQRVSTNSRSLITAAWSR